MLYLDLVAAVLDQPVKLRARLNSLGDGIKVAVAGQADRGATVASSRLDVHMVRMNDRSILMRVRDIS